MAYDSPLSALEDIGRILDYISAAVPAAAGIAPLVAQYRKHLEDMRAAAVVPMRVAPPLPDPVLLQPEPEPAPAPSPPPVPAEAAPVPDPVPVVDPASVAAPAESPSPAQP